MTPAPGMPELLEKLHQLELEITRLQEQKRAADIALDLAREALLHSQAAANEWRQENIDQRALFITEEKARGLANVEEGQRRALEGRVAVLEKAANQNVGGRIVAESVWVKAGVIASLLIGIAALILHYAVK